MSKIVEKPKLTLELNVPEYSQMRITPPTKLEPLKMSLLEFNYQDSQYQPFSQEILQKIGVKFDQSSGVISSLVSELTCINCTACKAISKDTLMQLDPADIEKTQKSPIVQQNTPSEVEPQDETKKEKYQQIWNDYKKKQIRINKIKFEVAFKEYHNLSESQWQEHIKTYFQ